ncbi:hypothetical protein CURE108131_11840 [Cupriavidus respiraculi]|uniref:Uncharacterized protein n=1 Tax=Cupriavidus respiraculi TaxID=195930 RepID=A0ABM8WW39_9BURK|nr:hypothetical protein [Cupriavidus respiraculi]CAG9171689.1 hypothetical protein LMG21510_01755 [Cupriavidus respiraculi]
MIANDGFVNAGRSATRADAESAVPGQAPKERHRWAASHWWQAGVYCSGPAIFLWIAARLPEDMLVHLFRGGPNMPAVLNNLGDALFFCGWAISGILLWASCRSAAARGNTAS